MPYATCIAQRVVERKEKELRDAVGVDVPAEVLAGFARKEESECYGYGGEVRYFCVESRFVGPEGEGDKFRYKKDCERNPEKYRSA